MAHLTESDCSKQSCYFGCKCRCKNFASLHILCLETSHPHDTIENTLEVLHIIHKWKHMNTIEKFHIHNLSGQILNDSHSVTNNTIFRH
jgi:hypothetical protein